LGEKLNFPAVHRAKTTPKAIRPRQELGKKKAPYTLSSRWVVRRLQQKWVQKSAKGGSLTHSETEKGIFSKENLTGKRGPRQTHPQQNTNSP